MSLSTSSISFSLFSVAILLLSLAKKFKKVVGKETCSDTLESIPMLEKQKFPQDYFPEVGNRFDIDIVGSMIDTPTSSLAD